MAPQLRHILIVLAVLLLARAASGQSSIELRTAASVPDGVPVTLEHVARLDGPDAAALGATVLLEPEQRARGGAESQITLDDIRRALKDKRVNWGRITLRGAACRLVPFASASPPPAPPPARAAPRATEPIVDGTVRAAAIARLCQVLGVSPPDLEAAFAPEDAGILDLPTAGRTLEIRPIGLSDRLPLAISLYEKDRVVAAKSIRVGVRVRRPVVIIGVDKRRGEMIDPAEVTTESKWLGPGDTPASLEQTVGAGVRSRLDAGQVVLAQDVEPLVAVRKGEVIAIRCISGSLVLSTRGRALAAGKDGELVQFQALDSKRTFYARMDGRGRAIIVARDSPVAAGPGFAAPNGLDPYEGGGPRLAAPLLTGLEMTR